VADARRALKYQLAVSSPGALSSAQFVLAPKVAMSLSEVLGMVIAYLKNGGTILSSQSVAMAN
jgi:hypothetical protein